MKHYSLFGWLLLLPLFVSIISCDHRDPAPRFRVKTITTSLDYTRDYVSVYKLTYNASGQLETYTNEPYPANQYIPYTRKITGYTSEGLIKSVEGIDSRFNVFGQSYVYDAQKRLIQINYESVYESVVVYDFAYDGASTTPSSKTTTKYNLNMNAKLATRTETYTFTGGNATVIDGKSYTYDSTPNPYFGLVGFSTFLSIAPDNRSDVNRPFSISEGFSSSSVKAFNRNNRTNDAQLTYNSDGLVTKIAYNDGRVEEFTYESY